MAIWDLYTRETGSGGDFLILGNDLAVDKSIGSAIYMAMFGGNTEADTQVPRQAVIQDLSYWGNAIFMQQLPYCQFNSLTERTLNATPLTSAGRPVIEAAIKQDMAFLGNVTVTVVIVSTDRINVTLKIILPSGLPAVATFVLSRNPITGDFDFSDFSFEDFF